MLIELTNHQVRSSLRMARDLTIKKKLVLAAAAIAALALPIAIGIMSAARMRAESPSATPKFEVATVKSCNAFRKPSLEDLLSPGRLHTQCTTVQRLIQQAYGLFANGQWNLGSSLMVTGGPAWTESELYEIEAQAKGPQSRAIMNGPMLQNVLENRFKLRVHRLTREVPVYALTVAEGGPNLQPYQGSCVPRDFDKLPSEADCGTERGFGSGLDVRAATIADLCASFSVLLDRHVMDKTGITGRFDIHLDLSAENRQLLGRPRSLPALSDPTAPAPPPLVFDPVNTALTKLGLKLEPAMGPGEFIALDRIERPSAN